jgi:hypothetical protein
MTANNTEHPGNCRFWSALSMKCRICKEGLFIPLDNHIEMYCKTTEYPHCLQYMLHSENIQSYLELTKKDENNRRKYERYQTCHQITLVRLVQSGKIASHYSIIAKTLDLSSGGMRLTTKNPLINHSLVQFTFDQSFPENLQNGTGQVAWCNKQIDEPGYQAGITFQDDRLITSMDRYLVSQQFDM